MIPTTAPSRALPLAGRLLVLLLALALVLPGIAVAQDGATPGATPAATPASTPGATPAASGSVTISGDVLTPLTLTVADVATRPAETVDVTFTAGGEPQAHTFTGTRLLGLIEEAGLDVPADARNPLLGYAIVVTATDGYQVVFSGGELDPNFGAAPILLAWEADGGPITDVEGPLRIVVPGDERGGRYVSGVVDIAVVALA